MIVSYVRKTFTVLATGERYNIQHNDTQQKTIFPKDNRENKKCRRAGRQLAECCGAFQNSPALLFNKLGKNHQELVGPILQRILQAQGMI
jgi:hypothetical protein